MADRRIRRQGGMLLDGELPQIVKMLRECDAEGVSLKIYAVTIFGFVRWTTYCLLARASPAALSNATCIGLYRRFSCCGCGLAGQGLTAGWRPWVSWAN